MPLNDLRRPSWLPESAWPWPLRELSTSVGRIAVTDTGTRAPLLLFAHAGMWSFLWRDVIALMARDFRCVTFDAPGTGLSERRPAGLQDAAIAIGELIDALDLRDVALVVHDLGGGAAFAAAASRTDRISNLVAVN